MMSGHYELVRFRYMPISATMEIEDLALGMLRRVYGAEMMPAQFSSSAFNRSVYAELDRWITAIHVDEI